jgi:hypothetical protein
MRCVRRLAGSLPAAIAIAALCACGSSGSTSAAPSAQQQAQSQALQASRALADKLRTDNVVWSKGIIASYDQCGSGNTHVQYVANQPLESFDSSLAPTKFNARLVSEMSGAGWKLTPGPKPGLDTVRYNITDNGLGGQLFINDGPTGENANLFIDTACFDAGSAAAGLRNVQSTYPAPTPSSTSG